MGALKTWRRGRVATFVPCGWCGAPVTMTQHRRGHKGCTHVPRACVRHGPKSKTGDRALLAACERELERWWIAEGWGVRPPSVRVE